MMKQVWLLFLGLFAFSTVPVLSQRYLPQTPCPQVFRYAQGTYGQVEGLITVGNDYTPSLFLAVNASMLGYFGPDRSNMKIQLLTPAADLFGRTTPVVRYSLKFPVQESIPKITEIVLNGLLFCRGPPHILTMPGPPITNMYSTHRFLFSSQRNANDDGDDVGDDNDPSVIESAGI